MHIISNTIKKWLLLHLMEQLIRHIETLIRRHDYVIVPDFGGFVVQHQPAVISDEQLHAPRAVVGFNPLMNVSDGLLAIEVSRAENKSFREAVLFIESEIQTLKTALKTSGKANCGCLGELRLNAEQKITFTPSENSSFLPANYGLTALYYSKATPEEENRQTVTLSIPSKNRITRYAAIGIIAVGLFFTVPKLNDARRTMANFNPTGLFETTEQVENPPATSSIVTQNAAAPLEEAPEVAQLQKTHHVIVGCMATQKAADELCTYLKNEHYADASVLPPIKTYRVAIASFAQKAEAIAYMENLRKTKAQFAEAWVLSEN